MAGDIALKSTLSTDIFIVHLEKGLVLFPPRPEGRGLQKIFRMKKKSLSDRLKKQQNFLRGREESSVAEESLLSKRIPADLSLEEIEKNYVFPKIRLSRRLKQALYLDFLHIYDNREILFTGENEKYKHQFAQYLHVRLEQASSTSYDDARVIVMLSNLKKGTVLESKKSLVAKLKLIAKNTMGREDQKRFLEKIESMSISEIKKALPDGNKIKAKVEKIRLAGVKAKLDRRKGTLKLITKNTDKLEKLNRITELLTDENLDAILSGLEKKG